MVLPVPGTKASGSGIGLTSIERMLERAVERNWIESEAVPGSTFHLTVPVPDETAGC